ncbi:hypothetical protein GHT06_012457 [Daphnia sinensis]|uniref:Uncharacterized protein n=1 Tax=Daphnia sinensis TaxID=1820382 RepID=A0AAD5KVP5_9CRUS|nr:hypothetical protein GHT06_012457 [Daphnia sinensis]
MYFSQLTGALLIVINLKEADAFTIPSDGVRGFESHESRELFTSAEDHHLKTVAPQRPANNGQVISRHSDERDDSTEFRIAVGITAAPAVARNPMIRTVNQVTRAPTANVRLPVSLHSDEHDDLSDEVRSITGILSSRKQVASTQTTPNAGSQAGQRVTKHPDERLIVSAQPGKQVIIRTVTTPVSVQAVPIHKAIFRHSDERDDHSDEIVLSRMSVPNKPPIPNVPALATNPAGLGQTTNPQPPLVQLRSGGRVDLPWLEHDDDIDVQIDPVTKQVVNVRAEQKDSIEHDDLFSDEIIRARIPPSPTTPALGANPVGIQTPVNGPMLSQQSFDTVARVLNQQNIQIRPETLGAAPPIIVGGHVIDHSDEVDDHSLEIHHVRSGMSTQSAFPGVPVRPANPPTDVRHLFRDSNEDDVSLEDVIRSHVPNVQTHRTPVQQGFPRDSDERDLSSEVVRRLLNQQNVTRLNQAVHRVSHSDERDDTSAEVILHVRNGTTTIQRMPLTRYSHEHDDTSDEMLGIGRSLPIGPTGQQGVIRVMSRQSHERDDSMEMIGLVRKTAVTPHETTVIGGHVIRHSDEIEGDSSEMHHVGHQPASVLATAGVGHHSAEHDVSIEDVIGVRNRPLNGQIQAAPVHPGVRILEDSFEHDDSRERGGRVLDHQGRQINTTVYLHRDSDEHDDLSLEVDLSLLPEIQRLFTDVRMDAVAPPPAQNQGVAASVAGRSHGNQAVHNAVEMDVSLEVEDILANPLFQQKIQEIDDRLKSAPDARGKRLIEKYAEALALSSPSFNSAPSIIQSSFYLPLLFTCLMVCVGWEQEILFPRRLLSQTDTTSFDPRQPPSLMLLNTVNCQSSNPAQVAPNHHGMRPGQTFTLNGHVIGVTQSHERDDISMEVIGRVANAKNVQATPGQPKPSIHPAQQGVLFSRDSIERHDLSLEDVIGRNANRQHVQGAQQRPAVVPAGQGVRFSDDSIERHDLSLEDVIGRHSNRQHSIQTQSAVPQGRRPFRDSDEHRDVSLEDLVGRVPHRQHAVQNNQAAIQQGVRHFWDSDEHDDVSYEVDFSLLPQLLRLLQPTVQSTTPPAPSQGQRLGQQVSQRYDEHHEVSLEFNEILANPTFQQKIQEIDDRLKRASGPRGKRLMEKYATALAVYSTPPGENSSPSMNSSYYLPFFIACFWAWFL